MKLSNNNKQKKLQSKCFFLTKINLVLLKLYRLNPLKLPSKIVLERFKIEIIQGIQHKILKKKLPFSHHFLNIKKKKLKISLFLVKNK